MLILCLDEFVYWHVVNHTLRSGYHLGAALNKMYTYTLYYIFSN